MSELDKLIRVVRWFLEGGAVGGAAVIIVISAIKIITMLIGE